MPSSTVHRAMMFMALYGIVQSLVWGVVRYLGTDLSTATLFFFRNLIGFLTIVPLLWKTGPSMFKTDRFGLHALRALVAFTGGLAAFYAVSRAPLASVTAITYAAPIFASLFAMIFFREGLTWHRILVLPVGFIGVLMVLRPSFDIEFAGMVGAVIATVTTAIAFLTVKSLSATERSETVVAYPFLMILPVSALIAYFDWTTPTVAQLPLVLLMGAGISLSQYCMVKAFALADASAVLPVDFMRIVVAATIGILFFGDLLDVEVLLGAAIILGVTIYSAGNERRDARVSAQSHQGAVREARKKKLVKSEI